MFLTGWSKRSNGKARPSQRRRRSLPCRPVVEILEPRCLLTLTAAPTTFTGTEGADVFPATIATITINWGDGTPLDTTTGTAVPVGGGTFNVTGHHTYAEEAGSVVPPAAFN